MEEATQVEAPAPTPKRNHHEVNVGDVERKASMVGGAALALGGLRSLTKKHYLPGLAMMAAGGLFFYRGKSGHCEAYHAMGVDTASSNDAGVRLEKVLTVNRPRQQVYEFWHNLENLPRFIDHLDSVQVTGDKTSHWRASGPGGISIEWDAEMMDDPAGEEISWHSVGATDLPNKGTVEFKDAPGNRGTEVKVTIDYYPRGGAAGKAAAKLMRGISAHQLEGDLKRLKQILETGEIATAETTYH